jgi:hypothetical protein
MRVSIPSVTMSMASLSMTVGVEIRIRHVVALMMAEDFTE